MTEPFVIAHKVRGEPAFDIAINIGSEEDGDLWIIPTSGHRAFPYWYRPLVELYLGEAILTEIPPMPADLRDHYHINDAPPRKARGENTDLPPPALEDLA